MNDGLKQFLHFQGGLIYNNQLILWLLYIKPMSDDDFKFMIMSCKITIMTYRNIVECMVVHYKV